MFGELANHLWQSTLFTIVAGLITFTVRSNRARVRYWLWFSASCKFFVPFSLLVSLGSYMERASAAHRMETPAIAITMEQITQRFPDQLPFAPFTKYASWILPAIIVVWVCGFAVITLVRLRGWLWIRAAVRSSIPAQIAALNFPSEVEIRCAAGLLEPGVIGLGVGWSRSILLLPAGLTGYLTPPQLEAVLAHEFCHVRRRDNLFASIHMIAEAIFWFHPLVWWIGARLVEERERACDEEVLSMISDPKFYAEGILNVCKLYVESPLVCVSGVTGANVKQRIEMIMTKRIGQKLNRAKEVSDRGHWSYSYARALRLWVNQRTPKFGSDAGSLLTKTHH